MKSFKSLMILAAVLSFFTAASNVLLLAVSAYLIAAAALQPPLAALMATITGVRFFGLSRAVFRYGERYLAHRATFQVLSAIRVWLYARIESLTPARLLTVKSGDLLAKIISDVDTLQFFYLRVIVPAFVTVCLLICLVTWLFTFDASFGLIVIAAFGVACLLLPWLCRKKIRLLAAAKVTGRAAWQNMWLDTLAGLTEVTSCQNTAWQFNKLKEKAVALENKNKQLNTLVTKCEALKNWGLNLSLTALFLAAAHLAANGNFEKVWLAVLVITVEGCLDVLGAFPGVFFSFDEAVLSLKSILGITAAAEPARRESVFVPDGFNLRVANLSFAYENSAYNVLSDISFEMEEGSHLAIVGTSGAGKSTLINILCRFFPYQHGNITFGGQELNEYQADTLRSYLSVVSQSGYIFNASVKDNILLAKPAAAPAEFEDALHQAGLTEFLNDEALLNKPGAFLSGGERQKVALARAFLKNAPFLILDEPLASVDNATAQKLMLSLNKLMQNRSAILITHNFNLLSNIDKIIFLEQGKIREQGTLAALLEQNGPFAQMYAMQSDLLKW